MLRCGGFPGESHTLWSVAGASGAGRRDPGAPSARLRAVWGFAWSAVLAVAVGVRLWNALAGPMLWGYDAWGHVAYALFLELYRALPWADQGWSYFHPPLHYALGFLLAQFSDAVWLARGLALWGSAASLGIAAIAAQLARRAFPARRELALVAFATAALLPVQLYVSPMPGNKLSETLLSTAAVGLFVAGERRPRATLGRDLAVGALLGLALLAAASGLLALLAILASLPLLHRRERASPQACRAWQRALRIAAVALALASPYYGRNWLEFGVPFRKSSDVSEVRAAESRQGPGERPISDLWRLSPRLFAQPDPLAPALLHSIPGTLYAGWWSDLYRESLIDEPVRREQELAWRRRLLAAALLPTALAAQGAALWLRDLWRGRRRATGVPVALLFAANLVAYALHAYWLPRWTALKAIYFLGATLPFALCSARGALAWLGPRPAAPARAGAVALALAVPGLLAALATSEGTVLAWRGDSPALAATQYYFEDWDAAGAYYGRLAEQAPMPLPWLENLAAVELARGRPERARVLSLRAAALAGAAAADPLRAGRVAVAAALSGRVEEAAEWLERGLALAQLPELLANRGALRAVQGRRAEALRDFDAALALEPELCVAWSNRADLLAAGRAAPGPGPARLAPDALRAARLAVQRCRCEPPRRYPHGLGSGEILEWGVGRRPLLRLSGSGLALAARDSFRRRCAFEADT